MPASFVKYPHLFTSGHFANLTTNGVPTWLTPEEIAELSAPVIIAQTMDVESVDESTLVGLTGPMDIENVDTSTLIGVPGGMNIENVDESTLVGAPGGMDMEVSDMQTTSYSEVTTGS